jgi:hypothetical protein
LFHEVNQGVGGAVITGYQLANQEGPRSSSSWTGTGRWILL